MARKAEVRNPTAEQYRVLFAEPSAADVMVDLTLFAMQETDPSVRAGRLDMLARIIRMQQRSRETEPDQNQQESET